ncbi:hypothetical protein ACPC54_27430 [Kitasatospora sp. NPDC094028]
MTITAVGFDAGEDPACLRPRRPGRAGQHDPAAARATFRVDSPANSPA